MKTNKKTLKTIVFSLGLAALTLTANHLNAQDRGLFGMGKSSADYDYNYSSRGLLDSEGISASGFTNADFGEQAPLGSGIAILLAAGMGYVALKKKEDEQ